MNLEVGLSDHRALFVDLQCNSFKYILKGLRKKKQMQLSSSKNIVTFPRRFFRVGQGRCSHATTHWERQKGCAIVPQRRMRVKGELGCKKSLNSFPDLVINGKLNDNAMDIADFFNKKYAEIAKETEMTLWAQSIKLGDELKNESKSHI